MRKLMLLFCFFCFSLVAQASSNNPDKVDVYLVPMADFPESFAAQVAQFMAKDTQLWVKSSLRLGQLPLARLPGTNQLIVEDVIGKSQTIIKNFADAGPASYFILLTTQDINLAPGNLRFVFSGHNKELKTSVVSLQRLSNVVDGKPVFDDVSALRLYKIIKRAIGEMQFGWQRVSDKNDIMYSPLMGIDDLDQIGLSHRQPIPSLAANNAATSVSSCSHQLPLSGVVSLAGCDASKQACLSASQAIFDYTQIAQKDDDPSRLDLFSHASPWHFYDSDMRIVTIPQMVAKLQPILQQQKIRQIRLHTSWSELAPDTQTPSLTMQLAAQLPGMVVTGQDGFVWLHPDGSLHTTRHAFTVRPGGPYLLESGQDVLVPMAVGQYVPLETEFRQQGDAQGLFVAAAGWEINGLCLEQALRVYEEAAQLGQAIAAYNAALIHWERGNKTAALALLKQAAQANDGPAQQLLEQLQATK